MMLGQLGLFYKDRRLVRYSLYGPRGMLSSLAFGMVDDGLWCESSLTYHFTAIVPMVYLAEALRNAAWPDQLYQLEAPNGRTIKQAYDAIFGVLFPDGSIPPIGDAYGRKVFLHDELTYYYLARVYDDPRYRWLLQRASRNRPEVLFIGCPSGPARAPSISSRLYPEHGYALLRNRSDQQYWDADGWCAFLNFDRSGVHCHQDKLSLMLFGCSKLLIPDVEARATVPHAFSAEIQRQLNRSALSQNTVMIDWQDQRPIERRLYLEEYRDLPSQAVATAADLDGWLYPGVRQSRTVCVTDDYVLDVFQVVAEQPHQICWIVHTIGHPDQVDTPVELTPRQIRRPGPARWLRTCRAAESDESVWFEFSQDGVRFRITLAAEPATEFLCCGYPLTDEPDCPTTPLLLVQRQANRTVFAAVYQAGRTALPQVHLECSGEQDGYLVYTIAGPWGPRQQLIPNLR